MGLGTARRIAKQAHRGQLLAGGLFADHLDRIARQVSSAGGGAAAVQAAWLYAVPTRGLTALDLYRAGIPAEVVRIVEILRHSPYEWPESVTDRILHNRDAALIRYAVLADSDLSDPRLRADLRRLADALGLPTPPIAEPVPDTPRTPGPDGHLGPQVASLDLSGLLTAYHAERDGLARNCCLTAVRGAISARVSSASPPSASGPSPSAPGTTASAPGTDPSAPGPSSPAPSTESSTPGSPTSALGPSSPASSTEPTPPGAEPTPPSAEPTPPSAEPTPPSAGPTVPGAASAYGVLAQWWDSADEWECMVAVIARAAANDPADRAALLAKIDLGRPNVAAAAIRGLRGPGDDEEIDALAAVVGGTEAGLRWVRAAAVRRLRAIGSRRAEAVLRARPLTAVDPPWRDDAGWLTEHAGTAVPALIEQVMAPEWWHEGPFVLGELRVVAAVPVLCRLARSTAFPVGAVEALGKIGSADAVPTLVELARHDHQDVRDHVLRALARIGDPRVVDAAVAACDDPHPVVRDRAARVLARHGDERAVVALIRLCDTGHAVRSVPALARIGDPRALPSLWQAFRTAPDRRTRHAAGRGLAAIDGPEAHVHLAGADLHVRRAYVWLLGHKPTWKPHYRLRRVIDDADPGVRANAAGALARLGDPADAELVRTLLDDPDPRVRAAALTATRRLRGRPGSR